MVRSLFAARRLFVLTFVVVAPLIAGCSVAPTGTDDAPPPPAPADSTDSTSFGEQWPWN